MTPSFYNDTPSMISEKEERELFEDLHIAMECEYHREEEQILTKILKQYAPIVKKRVRKLAGYKLNEDELINEGFMALTKAARNFDVEKGFRFSTYGMTYVRTSLLEYVSNNYFIIGLCRSQKNKKVFYNIRKAMRAYIQKNGYHGYTVEMREFLAEYIGVSIETVDNMYVQMMAPYTSIDQPVSSNEENDGVLTFGDLCPSGDTPQDIQIEEEQLQTLHATLVKGALKTLDARTRDIVQGQVLTPTQKRTTLDVFGKKYGISRERVRQLRERGSQKVEAYIKKEVRRRKLDSTDLFLDD